VIHRSVPNKPGTQQLAVYYEARDPNSYSFADSSNVYDLSGSGVTGTLNGGVGYDAVDNAFTFDGTSQYISGTQGIGTGQPVHSQSVWFKQTALGTSYSYVCYIGTSISSQQSAIVINESTRKLWFDMYSSTTSLRSQQEIQLDRWYHVVVMYTGGNWNNTNCKMYINGVEEMLDNSTSTTTALNLTGTKVVLNRDSGTTWTFTGSIANYRLFSKVLNADQVLELYEYDAERFGHRNNLVALHRGNLGIGTAVPAYTLDVLGNIYASGNIIMYSDARLKENIKVIENALDKVCSISGYTFNKKGETVYNTGVLAQEVLRILPEVVHGSEETNYSVAYGNMVGILIEAIKELKAKNDALQDIVHRLANM